MSYKFSTGSLYFRDNNGDMVPVGAIIGKQGNDGFSPAASVTQDTDGVTIQITDKYGTTTGKITNGSDANLTIDSVLSDTSTNPVQNNIINQALNDKASVVHTHNISDISGLSDVAISGDYNDLDNLPNIPYTAGDVEYSETSEYANGTVGKEIVGIKADISTLTNPENVLSDMMECSIVDPAGADENTVYTNNESEVFVL